MRRFRLALLSTIVFALSTSAEPPKVASLPIVDRAIRFHGGEVFKQATTSLSLCSLSGCFELRAKIDGERFEYVVEGQSSGKQRKVRWWNEGLEQWLDGEPLALDAAGRKAAEDFVSARVYFPFLPFRLADAAAFKQDLGLEDWEGRKLHKVKVTFTPGSSTDADDEYLYWFDPETGRLEQFAYSFDGGLRFRKARNYRTVSGVLFFDQENWAIDGAGLEVETLTPAFVKEKMQLLSVVELKDLKVELNP